MGAHIKWREVNRKTACRDAALAIQAGAKAMGLRVSFARSSTSISHYVYVSDGDDQVLIRISDHPPRARTPEYDMGCDEDPTMAIAWLAAQFERPMPQTGFRD